MKLPTSVDGRVSFDAAQRMQLELPNVAKVMTDMCAGQSKGLAEVCKTLQKTWETRKKAYTQSLLKARLKYLSGLAKRVAASLKRKEFHEAREVASESEPIVGATDKTVVALKKKIDAAELREEKAQAAREAAEARRAEAQARRDARRRDRVYNCFNRCPGGHLSLMNSYSCCKRCGGTPDGWACH